MIFTIKVKTPRRMINAQAIAIAAALENAAMNSLFDPAGCEITIGEVTE